MKTFGLLVLVACATIVTAIPVGDQESKNLNEAVRQKRGGWGYEPVYHTSFVASPQIHTTQILGPTKTIVTHAHPPVVSQSVVYPQKVISYPATTHSESVVWQTGPDHSYYVHQKHHPQTYYTYYQPTATHYVNGPVIHSHW